MEPMKNDVMQGNKELPTEPYYRVRRVGSDEVDEAERVFHRFHMMTLAINTASRKTSVALLKDDRIVSEQSWETENDEAEKLMPALDGIDFEKLERVVVIRGPGSFTALRVGIAVANAIAYLMKIPVFGVDTVDLLRAGINKKEVDSNDTALTLFAGRKEVYIWTKNKKDPILSKTEEASEILKKNKIKKIFGELLPEQKLALKGFQFLESDLSFGEKVLRLESKNLKESKIISPLYIKEPAISTPKKCFT